MSDTMRAKGLSSRTFRARSRSEEHTSELQSQSNLVCRLLLEKKKKHDKCLNQPLVEITALVVPRAIATDVVQLDMADVQYQESLDHTYTAVHPSHSTRTSVHT